MAVVFVLSVALFACDGTESDTEETTENMIDEVASEKASESESESESATVESASESETESSAPKAKDFTVYDADGNKVKLSDFFGKPIVLNFFASWCGPCKAEMPEFNKKYLEIGDEVQFLMVNLISSDTLEDVNELIESEGYSFPILYDKNNSASNAYRVYYIPMTVFIDREGYVVATETGMIDADTLNDRIDMIK